jgi:hypothetical protein
MLTACRAARPAGAWEGVSRRSFPTGLTELRRILVFRAGCALGKKIAFGHRDRDPPYVEDSTQTNKRSNDLTISFLVMGIGKRQA